MIHIIKSKDETYICTNSRKQSIFDFNGTIGLSERLENEEIKKLKKKPDLSKLEKTAVKHKIGITLCDLERILKINNTSDVAVTETEKPLELLARNTTEYTQFAFLNEKGARVLYGRDLGLKHVPEYFKGLFGTSDSRTELSYKVHDLIVGYLQNFDYQNTEKIVKSYTKLDFDSFFSKAFFSMFALKKKDRTNSDKKDLGRVLVGNMQNQEMMEEALYNIKTQLSLPTYNYKHINFIDVRCPKKDEKKVEKELKQNFDAYIAKTLLLPMLETDTSVQARYTNLVQIGAYEAQRMLRGLGVNVAVIDTGVDYNHEQLRTRFKSERGYDFVNETTQPQDDNGHGSHVAGIIAGQEVGVAPGCNLYALKVLDARGRGSEADLLSAIDWAIDNDIHVINMSLGSSMGSRAEQAAMNAALSRGILIAAAAGNDGNGSYNYPASYRGVISVAAVNHRNEHAYFSNHNDQVNISAPGVEIFSCYKNNSYIQLSGTSMATPHVAGTLALLLSAGSQAHLEELLGATAQKLGKSQDARLYFGAGLVRADDAVASIFQRGR